MCAEPTDQVGFFSSIKKASEDVTKMATEFVDKGTTEAIVCLIILVEC